MSSRRRTRVVETAPRITRRFRRTSSSVSLNEGLQGTVASRLRDAWKHNSHIVFDGEPSVELYNEPFKHCIIRHFLNTNQNADWLKSALAKCEMFRLHNDMYKFTQSADLQTYVGDNTLTEFKQFLNTECREWIQDITGIPLTEKVTVTCSTYELSDFRLCHDNMHEDRRIAFVLYLCDNWLEKYGGALQMFSSNDEGQPTEIVQTIFPEFNKFVFFEVTEKAFHQVQEILAPYQFCVTVNGWFHGPPIERSRNVVIPPEPLLLLPVDLDDSEMASFVNDMYLVDQILQSVCSHRKFECCVGMGKFLRGNRATMFIEQLNRDDVQWKEMGPPNFRKYDICVTETLSADWQRFLLLMRSYHMFSLMAKVAGLMLKPVETQQVSLSLPKSSRKNGKPKPRRSGQGSENETLPKCRFEIQRWKSGYYSVVQDGDFNREFSVLEAFLFLIEDPLESATQGGSISYVGRDEENVLVTVHPRNNSLLVAYKNKNVASFTSYVNSQFSGTFYVVKFIYG